MAMPYGVLNPVKVLRIILVPAFTVMMLLAFVFTTYKVGVEVGLCGLNAMSLGMEKPLIAPT